MMVNSWLEKLMRVLGLAMLMLSAVFLMIFSTVQSIFPNLSIETLLGLVVAALAILAVDVYNILLRTTPGPTVSVLHLPILDGIKVAAGRGQHIEVLRILATTTEFILPAVQDARLLIKDCRVMLANFERSSPAVPDAPALAAKAQDMAQAWVDLKNEGVLDKLELRMTDNIPDLYAVIFDARAVVFGLYYPSAFSRRIVDFTDAVVVDDSTSDGKLMISRFTEQFEKIFEVQEPSVSLPERPS